MNDIPKTNIRCPLCEGRGQMPKSELFERLREKDLAKKMETYLGCIVAADQNVTAESNEHVQSWNLTHFLWRRSPKE